MNIQRLPESHHNIILDAEHEEKFRDWARNRGGVLVWYNAEIGGMGAREVFTPALTEDGKEYPPPNWRYTSCAFVHLASVRVREHTTVEFFRGRTKREYWGLSIHPQSEAKAKRIVEKYGKDNHEFAWSFDYQGIQVLIQRVSYRPLNYTIGELIPL